MKNDVSISHFTSSKRSTLHSKSSVDYTKRIYMRSVQKARKHRSPKFMVSHIEKTKDTIQACTKVIHPQQTKESLRRKSLEKRIRH